MWPAAKYLCLFYQPLILIVARIHTCSCDCAHLICAAVSAVLRGLERVRERKHQHIHEQKEVPIHTRQARQQFLKYKLVLNRTIMPYQKTYKTSASLFQGGFDFFKLLFFIIINVLCNTVKKTTKTIRYGVVRVAGGIY